MITTVGHIEERLVIAYCGICERRTKSRDMPQVPDAYSGHGSDRPVSWIGETRLPHVVHIILPTLSVYIELHSCDHTPEGYPAMA